MRIWTVGASVRALAQSLVRAGIEPICADQFGDADLRTAYETQVIHPYPQGLLQLADDMEADAWLYTGGLENQPDLIESLSKRLRQAGNCGAALRQVRDVWQLSEALAANGFSMPEMSRDPAVLQSGKWLRKSLRSAGGLRVFPATEAKDKLPTDEYFQQFIEGSCYGAAFVAQPGQVHYLGTSRQLSASDWTHSPGFAYSGSIGPISPGTRLEAEIQQVGELLARAFGLLGWFGVDFLVDHEGNCFVLEVNPRYTASMEVLERATGGESASLHLAAFGLGESNSNWPGTSAQVAGKAILYANKPLTLDKALIDCLMHRVREQNDLADIPGKLEIEASEPILTVFSEGKSEAEVESSLRIKAADLYRQLGVS